MNNFSKDNTLNNLLETTKNIFLTLINNPDYQGIGKKSREDVVMQEAMQRAKQHERNRLALALAIQNSHVQRFSDFVFKADGDPTDEDIKALEAEADELLRQDEINRQLEEAGAGYQGDDVREMIASADEEADDNFQDYENR